MGKALVWSAALCTLGSPHSAPGASEWATDPATRIEFRLAEADKAEGLVEAKVAATDKKVYLHKKAVLSDADVAAARVVKSGDRYELELTFTPAGAKKLEKATGNHIGKPLAILVDGKVVSAPLLMAAVAERAVISGDFSKQELQELAQDLEPR
ncbi:MAG: hypothetical protein AB7K24_06515 [Gemmataceae bacterium]